MYFIVYMERAIRERLINLNILIEEDENDIILSAPRQIEALGNFIWDSEYKNKAIQFLHRLDVSDLAYLVAVLGNGHSELLIDEGINILVSLDTRTPEQVLNDFMHNNNNKQVNEI